MRRWRPPCSTCGDPSAEPPRHSQQARGVPFACAVASSRSQPPPSATAGWLMEAAFGKSCWTAYVAPTCSPDQLASTSYKTTSSVLSCWLPDLLFWVTSTSESAPLAVVGVRAPAQGESSIQQEAVSFDGPGWRLLGSLDPGDMHGWRLGSIEAVAAAGARWGPDPGHSMPHGTERQGRGNIVADEHGRRVVTGWPPNCTRRATACRVQGDARRHPREVDARGGGGSDTRREDKARSCTS